VRPATNPANGLATARGLVNNAVSNNAVSNNAVSNIGGKISIGRMFSAHTQSLTVGNATITTAATSL
jgi:hypothetical protein